MPSPGENLRINSARLWDSLMQMAQVGPGIAGGNNRQTVTDADAEGRALFKSWCDAAGLTMGLDRMGNMFMCRAGTDPEALPVYIGSHLDTQPTGGKYDGVLGVLGGLEVIRTLNDRGIRTKHPVVVTNWTNEEGARFAPAMLASGVFAGIHSLDYAYARKDPECKSFGAELARIGWVGDEEVGARKMQAYFELHIEQGPILEAEKKTIGVVTHCQGLWWLEFTLTGKEAHTGSTPMGMRVNAGLAMARIIEMVQEVAMAAQPDAVGGVGQVNFSPNSRNVLPGTVIFTVDIRSPDQAKLDGMRAEIERRAAAICDDLKVGCAVEAVGHFDPVTFTPELVGRVRAAAEKLGYAHRDIISGAGHDACWTAKVAPTTMVMCPCVDGLSHNEAEEISPEWAAAGADVLLHAVLETAVVVD
ncbi:N-carbamoyl-L-amino-acid hydrolase [Rhodobacter capsulatus]|uniref:Zn-dependent hydrolase n=1 Tax=Rhodobacter capsulatus TaxID=1061 RepID=UPI0006DCF100|nr:Zn-dependent hydrolase [Rhodobacter capsulatus]KQB12472.1 Zn-dependent hydrolase [Rhodobacter capsulatus]KQB15990.1 Zn-dependent hydrolase [Rhodobacter capsulatus]PZX26556.1 N-carbamoyl-L-amino-acid hydrolase [Rhodobacter capsulatus]